VTAPDGGLTADFVKEDSSSFEHNRFQNASVTAGTVYTISAYAKAGGRTKFILRTAIAGGNINCGFDLTSGTVTRQPSGFTCSIQRLPNGWYRCSATCTASVTASRYFALQLAIADPVDDAQPSYQGDNTSGLFLWGAQLEAGAFPTSYIPTTTATATRAADVASITGTAFSSFYNQTEGTVFSDCVGTFSATQVLVNMSATAANIATSAISLASNLTSSQKRVRVRDAASADQASLALGAASSGSRTRIAVAINADDFAASLDGGATVTDATGTVPTVALMEIGSSPSGVTLGTQLHRRLTYWPVRLANTTLQAITQP